MTQYRSIILILAAGITLGACTTGSNTAGTSPIPSASNPPPQTTSAQKPATQLAAKSAALTPGNMPAYCRGEASAVFKVRPQYIKTAAIKPGANGGFGIDGVADLGATGKKPFRCRFTAKREFIDVMSLVNEGRL